MIGIQLHDYIANKLFHLKERMIMKGIETLYYHSDMFNQIVNVTPEVIDNWIYTTRLINFNVTLKSMMIAANEVWKEINKERK